MEIEDFFKIYQNAAWHKEPFIKSYSINVLTVIMLREKFPFEVIQNKLKVSKDFVQTHFDRLDTLSRPG